MDDNTWEPEHSLNCPEVISKYIEAKKNKRTSGVRGTSKKLTYTEVEETEGEDAKSVYVNGGSSSSKSKTKSKPSKGKKSSKNPKQKKEEDYEVEDIAGEKMEKGKKYYLLKWKGKSFIIVVVTIFALNYVVYFKTKLFLEPSEIYYIFYASVAKVLFSLSFNFTHQNNYFPYLRE